LPYDNNFFLEPLEIAHIIEYISKIIDRLRTYITCDIFNGKILLVDR